MKNYKKFLALFLMTAFLITSVPVLWAQEAEKININQASAEEIAHLKGIGQKYAERIVQYRDENGPFESPEDIIKVHGIGTKVFDVNKDKITVK